MFSIKSPYEVAKELADRLRQHRLAQAWSREEFARRSGVSAASIKRFELTGEISLKYLLALCFTLGVLDDFESVLLLPEPTSIRELKKLLHKKKRQRGRRQAQ